MDSYHHLPTQQQTKPHRKQESSGGCSAEKRFSILNVQIICKCRLGFGGSGMELVTLISNHLTDCVWSSKPPPCWTKARAAPCCFSVLPGTGWLLHYPYACLIPSQQHTPLGQSLRCSRCSPEEALGGFWLSHEQKKVGDWGPHNRLQAWELGLGWRQRGKQGPVSLS